jgi:hypothetical protein
MDNEIEIPDQSVSKFVRNKSQYAFGDGKDEHERLAAVLGLTTPDQVRTSDVDMGLVIRFGNRITFQDYSMTFIWPPRNKPEIRLETVKQIKELHPDWNVQGKV